MAARLRRVSNSARGLIEGNEPLFRGFAVHDAWAWSTANPVVRLSFGRSNFKTPRRPYYRPMNLRSTSTTLPGASSARKCPQSSNSRTSTSRSADLYRSSSFPRNAMSFRPHRTSAGLFAKAARSCQIERSQSLAPTI